MLKIQSPSKTKPAVSGTLTLHLRMPELRIRVTFGFMDKLAVHLLVGTSFIDIFIKLIHQTKRKLVPHHSLPVPIPMLQKASSVTEKNASDIRQIKDQDLVRLVTPTLSKPKYITVARQIARHVMYETPVLVYTQAACLMKEVPIKLWPKSCPYDC